MEATSMTDMTQPVTLEVVLQRYDAAVVALDEVRVRLAGIAEAEAAAAEVKESLADSSRRLSVVTEVVGTASGELARLLGESKVIIAAAGELLTGNAIIELSSAIGAVNTRLDTLDIVQTDVSQLRGRIDEIESGAVARATTAEAELRRVVGLLGDRQRRKLGLSGT